MRRERPLSAPTDSQRTPAAGRAIYPFLGSSKSLLQGARPLKPPACPGPTPGSEPDRCPRPAHLALACRGGAPDVGAALRAPDLSHRPWARRGPAQPGQGPERRAGRVAAAAVVVAATAGSAHSGRSARTAVGHARSRRASQPAARRARLPLRPGSESGVRRPGGAGVRGAGSATAGTASDRPGAEGGAAGGDEVMPSEKAPDVTCSQSEWAARGQVTSAERALGAEPWRQPWVFLPPPSVPHTRRSSGTGS